MLLITIGAVVIQQQSLNNFVGELQNKKALKCTFDAKRDLWSEIAKLKAEKNELEDENENQRYLIDELTKKLDLRKIANSRLDS